MKDSAKKLSAAAMITAAALMLSYVEFLIPTPVFIPGVKLGLANIAVIFAMYRLNTKYAAAISFVRVALSSLLFTGAASFIYGICGAAFSILVMFLLKRFGNFSPAGVSVAGAVAHNSAQIAAAMLIMGSEKVAAYLPILILSGTVCGAAVGAAAALVIKKIRIG